MQAGPAAKPSVGVVFDADMGGSIDDALALALLYGLESKNESRVVGLSVTKSNLKSAAFVDAMSKFYFARPLPVGMPDDGKMAEDSPMLSAVVAKFPHTVKTMNDTADPSAAIRNSFTAQQDGNCIVLLAGPAGNLVRALALPGVKELVAAKVRFLMVVDDAGLHTDEPALSKLVADWPSPAIVCGGGIGEAVPFPGASIETDFAWAPAHPLVEAYRAFKPMPYDAPSTAMAAALHAIRPQEKYFGVADGGPLKFKECRQLVFDSAQKDRIVKAYTELVSIKPVQRGPRRS